MPRLEAYLALEDTVASVLNRQYQKPARKLARLVLRLVKRGEYDAARSAIQEFDVSSDIEKARGHAELIGLKAVILGASSFVPVSKTFVADSAVPDVVATGTDVMMKTIAVLGVQRTQRALNAVVSAYITVLEEERAEVKKAMASSDVIGDAINRVLLDGGAGLVNAGANLTTSRLRSYGMLRQAADTQISMYQINEVLDRRTCPVCMNIHGATMEVKKSLGLVSDMLHTTDPNELKSLAPFPSQKKDNVSRMAGMGDAELQAAGFMVPPFHPMCRGLVVPAGSVVQREVLAQVMMPPPPRKTTIKPGNLNVEEYIRNNDANFNVPRTVTSGDFGDVTETVFDEKYSFKGKGDGFFGSVVKENGFDGTPTVLDDAAIRSLYDEGRLDKAAYRGIDADPKRNPLLANFGGVNLEGVDFDKIDDVLEDYEAWLFERSNAFKTGDYYPGEGAYGSGTYSAEAVTDLQADGRAWVLGERDNSGLREMMFQDAPMTNLDEGLDTAIHYAHDDFGGVIMRVGADTDNEMSSVILSTMDEAASDKHLAYIQNLREQIPPNLLDAAGELIDTDEAKKWAALLDELTNNHNAGFASGGIDMVQIPEYRFNVFLNRSKMIVGEEVYIKPGLHRAMIEPSLAKHGIEGANEFSEATRDLILDRLEHKLQVEFGKGLEELLTERGAYALENRVSGIWTHESLVLRTTPELGVKKAKIVRGTLTTNVEELGGQLQNRLPSPTDNLNIGAKIEDLMYDSVDEFLDDMMHGRSPTAWNVELEDVVEEALNPVATRKGRLNVAQFIENNEASWVDAPPSGGVYRHKDTRTAAGWRSGDAFFEAVVKENGFDGKPSVLPEDFFRDKYRSEGVSKMSLRGMNADPYKNPLFEKFGEANLPRLNFEDFDGVMKDYEEWLFENSNQFKNGAVYGGEGIYGSGTYTAETLDSAKSTAENVAYARNRLPEFDEYWRYSDGAVIESRDASIKARDITEALEESAFQDAPANVINKGHKTSSEYSIHEFGGVQIRVGVDEAIPDVYTELQDWRGIVTGNEVPHLAEWEEIVADMKKQIPPDLLDDSGNLLVEASEEARKWNAAIGGLKSNHNAMWAAGGVDSQYVTDAGYNVFLNRSKMVVSEEVYIGSGFHRSMIPAVLKKHGLSDKFDDVYGNVVNKVRSKVGQLPGLEKAIQDVGIGVAGRLEDTIADKVSEVLSDTTAKLRTTPEKGLRGAKTVRGGFESIANELALELQKLDDFAALADEELYKLAVSIEDAVYDSADEFLDDVIHGRNPEAWARELEAVTEEVVKEPPPIVHVADKGPLEWAPGPAGLGPTQTKFSNSFYDEGVKDMLEGWTKNKKELTASIGDDLAEQAGRMNLPGKEGRLAKLRFEALADEHRAIKEYADEGFTSVNDALRTNFSKLTDTADDVMEEVRTLDRVLEKHGITVPKGETLEVYRGATNVTDAIRTPYLEVGDTFVDKAFVSTTFDRSVAEGFATSDGMNTVIRVVIPEGKKVGWIGNGDVISWAESELLLDRNSVFRVVDIERAVPFVPKNWLDDPLVSAYKKMDVITVVME